MSTDPGESHAAEWGVLAGLWLAAVSLASYEIVPASVTPLVMEQLRVGPVAAGWLLSVMFGTGAVMSIPVGVLLDRVRVRRAIAVCVLALAVAGAWGWQATRSGAYWSLLASRALGGLAYIAVWNAGANLVGRVFPADRRAFPVGLFTAGAPAGFALGQFGGPLVAERFGLAAIFPAFSVLGLVGGAVFLVASRGVTVEPGETETPSLADFRAVLASRSVWLVSVMAFLAFSAYLILNSWMPSYLSDVVGLSLARSGLLVALFPAVGIVGRSAGGLLSDRVFGGRRRPVVVLGFAVLTPAVVGIHATTAPAAILLLLGAGGLFVQFAIGLLYTYVGELVDPAVSTTAVAALSSIGTFGSFSGPLVAGALIARTGSYAPALGYAAVVGLVGLALALHAPEPDAAG